MSSQQPAPTPGPEDHARTAPPAGSAPALADCFSARPDTGPGHAAGLGPGTLLVLAAPPPAPGVQDWPGGTGKTQLAAYLASHWWQDGQIELLAWVNAQSRSSVLAGYAQAFAARAGSVLAGDAETAAARFLSLLSETTDRWLVVLDDVTDPADVTDLWPAGPAGRVVVTTLNRAVLPDTRNAWVFPVGAFSPHEALDYLRGRLSTDPDKRMGAVDLVHDLGCDPLALAQASATIASSGLTCRDYRELFARRADEIAAALGAQPGAKAVTWTLSAERASSLAPGGLAQASLTLAALLGCEGIPAAVFSAPAAEEFIVGAAGGGPVPRQAREALASLDRTGLVTIDRHSAARAVRLHPAVQAAVLSSLPAAARDEAARVAARALTQAWPDDGEQPQTAEALRACVASLDRAAAGSLWAGGVHRILFRAGQSLDATKLSGLAVSHWQALAAASERALGPAHPDTLQATDRLASASLAAGLVAEAVAHYQQALDARTESLGAAHPSAIAARTDLGRALLAAGRAADAITVLEGALAAGDRAQPDPLGTLVVQDDLVAAYLAAGDHHRALRLATRTLAERERRQGPDHPDTLQTRGNLASACLAAGQVKDAIGHCQRALAGYERVAGPDDLATISAVSSLASAHHAARRLKDALPLYERALSDRERLQGPDHPDTLGARGNLASAYHSAGRLARALELSERTRADCQRVLGAYHPDTLAARANLAHAYHAMGRLTEAVKLLQDTLTDCERVLEPGDPLTAAVRESLDAAAQG